MFYTIYKTTNDITGHIYVGKHQTKILNDSYLGSGKVLYNAICKYGKQNFSKEILFIFDTEEEMNAKEAEMVTEEFCSRDDTYNLCIGGKGGFSFINTNNIPKFKGKTHSRESIAKMLETKGEYKHNEDVKKKLSENHWSKKDSSAFKHHASMISQYKKTDEHKKKVSETLKGRIPELIECPHCKKQGGINIMKRWHFDNCKLRDRSPGRGLSLPS